MGVALVALLAACPAPVAGGPPSYICANGTPVDGTTDASTDAGRIRCSQCDRFYKLNGTAGELGTICEQIAIGEATRISAATVRNFGVEEGAPFGLAAIGDTLYMVGWNRDTLYTLNIDEGDLTPDGTAIQVSAATVRNFGVAEAAPAGLAAIGDTLYMLGGNTAVLYTLNIDEGDLIPDGTAIRVSAATVSNFGVGEGEPNDLAAIGDTLYMAGNDTVALYTLNIDRGDLTLDGTAIRVSAATVSNFGVGEVEPNGLAAIGDTLYMAGNSTAALYTLNIDRGDPTPDGSAIRVGNVNQFGVGEVTPRGLAAIGNRLYMVGAHNDVLYALRYQ